MAEYTISCVSGPKAGKTLRMKFSDPSRVAKSIAMLERDGNVFDMSSLALVGVS